MNIVRSEIFKYIIHCIGKYWTWKFDNAAIQMLGYFFSDYYSPLSRCQGTTVLISFCVISAALAEDVHWLDLAPTSGNSDYFQ